MPIPPCSGVSSPLFLVIAVVFFVSTSTIQCNQYKVGDLDAWGKPTPSNHNLYSLWSEHHSFKIGDSLMFLYPPSQDSVYQVSETAFKSCDVSNPILKMTDGNSVFNLTEAGVYYFTSGVHDRCGKKQKIAVTVILGNGSVRSETAGSVSSDSSPFPVVFGPMPPASPSSSNVDVGSRFSALVIGIIVVNVLLAAGI